MKDVRFYAEMPETRRSKAASAECLPFTRKTVSLPQFAEKGNCLAVFGEPRWDGRDVMFEAIGPVMEIANGPVASCSPSRSYLRTRCIRISEKVARQIHPLLFATVDRVLA